MSEDDEHSLWSLIDSNHKKISRLQTSNDRIIARLLAAGVDEFELFEQDDHSEEEDEENFGSNPLHTFVGSQMSRMDKLQERNEKLSSLLILTEAEATETQYQDEVNFGSLDSDDLSEFLNSYFHDSDDKSSDKDDEIDEDPINNPQPSTSSGITHKRERTSKRSKNEEPTITFEDLFGSSDSDLENSNNQDDSSRSTEDPMKKESENNVCRGTLDDSIGENLVESSETSSNSNNEISQNTLQDSKTMKRKFSSTTEEAGNVQKKVLFSSDTDEDYCCFEGVSSNKSPSVTERRLN